MFGEKDIYPLGRLIGIMLFIMTFFCIYLFSQNKWDYGITRWCNMLPYVDLL